MNYTVINADRGRRISCFISLYFLQHREVITGNAAGQYVNVADIVVLVAVDIIVVVL